VQGPGKASGPAAWRLRTRQRQNAGQIRVRRSTNRGLRELAAGNVEECFDVCSDQGLHLDPDINISSHMDHPHELSRIPLGSPQRGPDLS
jgi:hypothetical protein